MDLRGADLTGSPRGAGYTLAVEPLSKQGSLPTWGAPSAGVSRETRQDLITAPVAVISQDACSNASASSG